MAPSAITERMLSPDAYLLNPGKTAAPPRTLLLAPPSIASHPEALNQVFEAYDRNHTDIQMLDRLGLGLVSLPSAAYDLVLLLTDANGTRRESQGLLGRDIMTKIVQTLRAGGRLCSQDGSFASTEGAEKTEAILAGLVSHEGNGMMKPDYNESQPMSLNLKRREGTTSTSTSTGAAREAVDAVSLVLNGKRKTLAEATPRPAGVGFVDFSDDFDEPIIDGEEDELIDEDSLLTEEDMARPIVQPPECLPRAGKRRRACKDCTCGLKEKIEAEDAAKRSAANAALDTLKLGADDLTEVDFTVQGKVGSCGNCALGDAFRCDGCPYIGLPAFKPGEEVRLLNNDVQL